MTEYWRGKSFGWHLMRWVEIATAVCLLGATIFGIGALLVWLSP